MLANNYGTIKWEHTLHLKNKEENKKKIKQIYFIEWFLSVQYKK